MELLLFIRRHLDKQGLRTGERQVIPPNLRPFKRFKLALRGYGRGKTVKAGEQVCITFELAAENTRAFCSYKELQKKDEKDLAKGFFLVK